MTDRIDIKAKTASGNSRLSDPSCSREAMACGGQSVTLRAVRRFGQRTLLASALSGAALLSLGACAPTVTIHGYVPTPSQIEDILPGIATRQSVADRIGRPSSTGLLSTGDWFYVQSTMEQLTYNPPRTTDRKVVAISFDDEDVVETVQVYGLEDGKIINLSPRITPTAGQRENILLRIFAGVLNFDSEALLADQ